MTLRFALDRVIYRFFKTVLWVLCHSYFWVTYSGRENIPRSGPVLLACHHGSFLDPIVIGLGVPRIVSYLARESLFRPPLGWLIKHLFTHPISRDSRDVKAIRTSQQVLKAGHIVLLFPEGTRTDTGRVKTFKAGVGMVALRALVPVVPVYVQGAYQCWPRRQWLPLPGRMKVFYGPALMPEEFAHEERNREGFTRVAQALEARVKNLEKDASL